MKFYKALMYLPIWQPTHWDLGNLDSVMITSEHLGCLSSINDALECSVIFPSDNEVDNYLYEYLRQINAEELHMYHYYSYIEMYDMVICINVQFQWHAGPLDNTE